MNFSQSWLFPALLCVAAWGVSRLFPKLATNHIDPKSALTFEVIGEVLVVIFILGSAGFGKLMFDLKGTSYAVLAGLFGGAGVYWYLVAADRGNVSQLVGVTALYPVITVILGVLVLNEPLTAKQIIGVGLAVVAVYLVSS
ncbi:MAG: transporter family protein [Gammaproteobacteria bacterium]|jgi:transporter family protein